jgi:signal transduction histidine kinase
MKLASTYQRFYLALLCLLLALGCLAYYLTIRYVLIHQIDNDLKVEQQEVLDFVRLHDSLPAPSHYRDQDLEWQLSSAQDPGTRPDPDDDHRHGPPRRFENARTWTAHEGRWEPQRKVFFSVLVKGRTYAIVISKSLEETEDLLWLILWVTVGSILILVGGLYIGNRFLLRRIWHPFYQTLDYLRKFSLSGAPQGRLGMSNIDEFGLLSRSVEDMTSKMQRDYLALQQFTDHAAHEMQTPLAVIKSKLDLMMQHPGLDEKQLEQMQQLLHSVNRLSRLNQSLLLLARIENRQFLEKESMSISTLMEEKLDLWQEWIREHDLEVNVGGHSEMVMMHPFLAESLVNNLLSNAVRHNIPGGKILVQFSPGLFSIQNTGQQMPLDTERLFQRFQKQGQPSFEGIGLGLAIIREIVELSGMDIRYSFVGGLHTFTVTEA